MLPYAGVCCCLSIPLLIASFCVFLSARSGITRNKDSFKGLVSDWNSDMVFDITPDPNIPLASNFYLTTWAGWYPGTMEGCFCSSSSYRFKVKAGLHEDSCSWNKTMAGCKGVAPTEAKRMDKWINSQTIYAVRGRGTSFFSSYKAMNEDGTCQPGFRQCGDKNSKSKGICIPVSFTECPLTDITSQSIPGYKEAKFTGFSIFTSNKAEGNPISDLNITESHLCLTRSTIPLSSGRQKYKLFLGNFENCHQDGNTVAVYTMGEKDLYDINGIPYQGLTQLEVDNRYVYALRGGRPLEWSPACKKDVEMFATNLSKSDSLASSVKTLFVLYIISLVVAGITFIVRFFLMTECLKKQYSFTWMIRLASFLLIFPSMLIVLTKASGLGGTLSSINEKQCSNDYTNQMMANLSQKFSKEAVSKVKWFFWLALIGFICEIVGLVLMLWFTEVEYMPLSNPAPGQEMLTQEQQIVNDHPKQEAYSKGR